MTFHRKLLGGFLAVFFILSSQNFLYASAQEAPKTNFKKVILTLDGGGARGIFQALFMQFLEDRVRSITKVPDLKIGEGIDFIAGTSTGSISGGVLSYPDSENPNKPKYSANFLVDYYDKNIDKVFKRGPLKLLISGFGLTDEKYSDKGFNGLLEDLFKDTPLTGACIPFLATAFELSDTGKGSRPYLFASFNSPKDSNLPCTNDKNSDLENVTFSEAIRSSGAAPTYFERNEIEGKSGKKYYFVDGGMTGANNPAALGYAQGKHFFENNSEDEHIKKKDVFCLSIGTGKAPLLIDGKNSRDWGALGWLSSLIPTMLDAPGMLAEDGMDLSVFPKNKYPYNYRRLQPVLEEDVDLADTSKKAISTMKSLAVQYIFENINTFEHISQVLAARYGAKNPQPSPIDLWVDDKEGNLLKVASLPSSGNGTVVDLLEDL